ncbi:MAG: hypothetical protein HYV02_06475 [Deltaproteobacteria bacterium]|nr:hypothetical protein [Deltaproteobacteria bacterium]
MGSKSFWNLAVQGGPLVFAALGDWARAHSTGDSLYAAGTYRDDPLGTQDPDSVTSLPMEFLIPSEFWGRPLSEVDRQELDVVAAQYAQWYFWGKLFKYGTSLGANAAAIRKIHDDPTLSSLSREHMVKMNWYDALGNMAFLVEKGCYALCLGAVGMAQFAGRQSPLWEVGYVGGALILNTALALATLAWYGKVKAGVYMLREERAQYQEAVARSEAYDINGAHLNVVLFNLANAVPRVLKHFVAHATTLALGLYWYAPELFSFLGGVDYLREATERLGEGTAAEHLYRWSNFGFRVPLPLVVAGLAFGVFAPIFGVGTAWKKTRRDLAEIRGLRRELAAGETTRETILPNGSKPKTVAVRLSELRREIAADNIGIVGALAVFGTGVAVSYPALEPHALLLTALYGFATFMQYNVREWPAIRALCSTLPERFLRYVHHQSSAEVVIIAPKKAPLWQRAAVNVRKTWRELLAARQVVKSYGNAKRANGIPMTWWQRAVPYRINKWRREFHDWRKFLQLYFGTEKQPSRMVRAFAWLGGRFRRNRSQALPPADGQDDVANS